MIKKIKTLSWNYLSKKWKPIWKILKICHQKPNKNSKIPRKNSQEDTKILRRNTSKNVKPLKVIKIMINYLMNKESKILKTASRKHKILLSWENKAGLKSRQFWTKNTNLLNINWRMKRRSLRRISKLMSLCSRACKVQTENLWLVVKKHKPK